ncbi:putative sensor with HAMP domain containing protein [Actinobacteria bacterium OK074]|nr:putative sensor with HAMP domain containing protein [Actinobacteria bacterium OK074]
MSLGTILLVLALVPSIALFALWAMNSTQLYDDWHGVHNRNEAAKRIGTPIELVFSNLQVERKLSAAALADPKAGGPALTRQRRLTDTSVQSLETLSGAMPADLTKHFQEVRAGLAKLPDYRRAVDRQTATQQQSYDDYTRLITADVELTEGFSDVGLGDLAVLTRPALDAGWGQEMLSREDAILTAGAAGGYLTGAQRIQLAEAIGAQQHIYDDKVIPRLPAARARAFQNVMSGAAWKEKTRVEQEVLNATPGANGRTAVSARLGEEWQQSIGGMTPQLVKAVNAYAGDLVSDTDAELDNLMKNLVANTAVGAAAVLLVFVLSLRLTGVLRRRILTLRSAALELQTRLPDLVERLRQGEKVDPDAELPEIRYGNDELGMLGQALNQARSSSLETAVRQVEQYRGFERLLQRIARRTQLLIGMQIKRLGEMERRHEDPEVLEGLFDLDHLAARLRRYEENLVILGGGQPQRRWRKPVPLLDILRSAQGEVQDYRRIRIESAGSVWLSERAVGPLVHVLAELMENAVSFSKPPTPVEVSASPVGRGFAVEIEDRGMGMDPDQYAEANELMADPPRMDVMSRADDARLGLYVVARLSANLGLNVEFRPSSFGGTRVVVLVPAELISEWEPQPEPPSGSTPAQLAVVGAAGSDAVRGPSGAWSQQQPPFLPNRNGGGNGNGRDRGPRPYGQEGGGARPLVGPWIESPAHPAAPSSPSPSSYNAAPPRPAPSRPAPSQDPLPRRVRQASLVAELRDPPPAYAEGPRPAPGAEPLPRRNEPRRAGATVGAFQRQSRIARLRPEPEQDHPPTRSPSPGQDRTRKEDR